MEKMNDGQIVEALKAAPEWSLVGEAIQRTFQFKDFVTSMKFVNAVAVAAEESQHHPEILIRYSRVTLTLATHDAGGITQKDFDLAKRSDTYFGRLTPPVAAEKPVKTEAKKKK